MSTLETVSPYPTLHSLDTNSFEQLVNSLALKVLGAGHTGFGPGRDGGRDGYFEGSTNYPSETENWSGVWYIQSKFHAPHLSKDSQAWLLAQIEKELKAFQEDSNRVEPDIWIVATNIDPSGVPETGCFDKARELVASYLPQLENKFHIWGGKKIIDLLVDHPKIAARYGHFLTPGNVLTALYDSLISDKVEISDIVRYLVIREFETHQFTKLDQAGSQSDARPGVHELFVDLPLHTQNCPKDDFFFLEELLKTSSCNHRPSEIDNISTWKNWELHPSRSRVWFIFGGPGQGKSTTSQYFSQIQRASLILSWDGAPIKPSLRDTAFSIKRAATSNGHWIVCPRIPVTVELREYAKWFGDQNSGSPRGILSYLCFRIRKYLQREVGTSSFKRALEKQSWFFAFDGLDEVPTDIKTDIASEVIEFIDDLSYECDCDALFVCTSRPQGYSGQLDQLTSMRGHLSELRKEKALECAKPVISIGRGPEEAEKGFNILESAIQSSSVASLMKTPLQSHIMAVIVRDGRKPPERRWALFENFYQVIKSREANRDLPDIRLARLLRNENKLLKSIHNKIGFTLHAAAERSLGAQTSINRLQFRDIAETVVDVIKSEDKPSFVDVLEEATETRLVLVNTPDDGENLRYDIRQLQEFFAAEYFYDTVTIDQFRERISIAGGDAHWREVMHFLFSAMVELGRVSEVNEIVILLQRIDTGDGDENLRDLSRRMAVGGSLAARLLHDGVLEQDKRVRTIFEQSFEPLFSTNESHLLSDLFSITHPESRSWLCNIAKKHLEESTPFESVGAALILIWNLTIEDPSAQDFLEIFRKKPIEFRREVLAELRKSFRGITSSDLYLRVNIEEMLAEDWHTSGSRSASILTGLYGVTDVQFKQVCKETGISDIEAEILFVFTIGQYSHGDENLVTQIGNVDILKRSQDKHLNDFRNKYGPGISLISNTGRGILNLAIPAIKFYFNPDVIQLQALAGNLGSSPLKKYNSLPYNIRRLIPFQLINHLSSNSEASLSDLLKTIPKTDLSVFTYRTIVDEFTHTIDFEDFKKLCENYPFAAPSTFFEPSRHSEFVWPSEYGDIFLSSIEKNVRSITRSGILMWGAIYHSVSESNRRKSIEILKAAFQKCDFTVAGRRTSSTIYHSFPIDCSLDPELVYHLLVESLNLYTFGGIKILAQKGRKNPPDHLKRREELIALLKRFINFEDLERMRSKGVENPLQRGIIDIILSLPDPSLRDSSFYDGLIETLESTADIGFLKIVLSMIDLDGGVPSLECRVFISNVLSLFKESFSHRDELSNILTIWREGSTFPVSASSSSTWEYC